MHRRIQVVSDPLLDVKQYRFGESAWPARWIGPQRYNPEQSYALVFRRAFELDKGAKFRVHLSADQRYELSVDGEYVGRGVERSDLKHWVYESYELTLKPGRHIVTVRLWWVAPGAPAPEAQQTHAPGLLVFAEGEGNEVLSTGVAKWQYQPMAGYTFHDHNRLWTYFATGARLRIDGREVAEDVERGRGEGWQAAKVISTVGLVAYRRESNPWWILRPAFLPPMLEKEVQAGVVRHVERVTSDRTDTLPVHVQANLEEEQKAWGALLRKGMPLVIPAKTQRRVIVDLEDYYCAYLMLRCTGAGANVRIQTAESLYHVPAENNRWAGNPKGNRDEIEGKCFYGVGFELIAGPKPYAYQPYNFMAGRYVEIYVRTGEQPLRIGGLTLVETHFPFRFQGKFSSDDPAHASIMPIALRTLEMCSHDTSMDCPYYERLNYVGDTRLQALVAYVAAGEERLARKCIEMFDISRQPSGLTYSRYPTRTVQTIPTFSLWWVCMINDFARWRGDMEFVRQRMVGVRTVMEFWRGQLDRNGLLRSPAGWNFVDWVPSWGAGVPAGGGDGFGSIINLQALYTLRLAAELEDLVGEPLLARRHREFADRLGYAIGRAFFDRRSGLFADDLEHTLYSEHAQCLAVLSGLVSGAAAGRLVDTMLGTTGLAQTTIYFSHYLLETLGQVGRIDALLARLETWKTLTTHGFRTTFESPEPSRSDCHAWGAHPVYHFLATIGGIRPAGFGFNDVVIRPQLGSLRHVAGQMPHRNGLIQFVFDSTSGRNLVGWVSMPEGVPGRLEFGRKRQKLRAGVNMIRFR